MKVFLPSALLFVAAAATTMTAVVANASVVAEVDVTTNGGIAGANEQYSHEQCRRQKVATLGIRTPCPKITPYGRTTSTCRRGIVQPRTTATTIFIVISLAQ